MTWYAWAMERIAFGLFLITTHFPSAFAPVAGPLGSGIRAFPSGLIPYDCKRWISSADREAETWNLSPVCNIKRYRCGLRMRFFRISTEITLSHLLQTRKRPVFVKPHQDKCSLDGFTNRPKGGIVNPCEKNGVAYHPLGCLQYQTQERGILRLVLVGCRSFFISRFVLF